MACKWYSGWAVTIACDLRPSEESVPVKRRKQKNHWKSAWGCRRHMEENVIATDVCFSLFLSRSIFKTQNRASLAWRVEQTTKRRVPSYDDSHEQSLSNNVRIYVYTQGMWERKRGRREGERERESFKKANGYVWKRVDSILQFSALRIGRTKAKARE